MLKVLRKKRQSLLVTAPIGAIVVVFVSWGIGTVVADRVEVVAHVNDDIISAPELRRALDNLQRSYREIAPNSLPPEVLQAQALDGLITSRLLTQEARRLGLITSDEEVRESIATLPTFQVGGRFDKQAYLRTLALNRIKPADFEESQRTQLLIEKLQQLITAGAHVTAAEVKDRFRFENERVNVQFVTIPSARFTAKVQVAESDLEPYLSANSSRFREPDRVRIQYLHFEAGHFAAEVSPSDDEIQAYYDGHPDDFRTPEEDQIRPLEEVRDRVIDAVRTRRARGIALQKAEQAYEKLLDRADLEEVARSVGIAVASPPPFARTEPIVGLQSTPELVEAVFNTEAGEAGEIVTVESGYLVFRVAERIASYVPELSAIRDRVEAAIRQERAHAAAKEHAAELQKRLQESKDLDALAASENVTVEETGPLSRRGAYVPKIGNAQDLKGAAFHLPADATILPGVYGDAGDPVIAVLKERLPADEQKFQEQEQTLTVQVRRQLEAAVVEQFVNYLKSQARIEIVSNYAG